jgi:hypothetical protein
VGYHTYCGADDTGCAEYAEELAGVDPECGKTTKIVAGLLAKCGLLDQGHHVYMDNYYNSPELADELVVHDTYCCGTLRFNWKEVPKVFSKVKKLPQGDCIFRRKENTLIIKYHDKRDLHMICTFHDAVMVELDKQDANGEPIRKPLAVVDYIQKMGGVDLNDQVLQYYEVIRKSVKWSTKLFFHLFNMMLVNAFVLFKKSGINVSNKKKAHMIFRQSVIKALLQESEDLPLPGKRGRRAEPLSRLTERHFPSHIPAKEGNISNEIPVCHVVKLFV